MSGTKEYYVYKHTNKTNGKVYIGITSTRPKRRWDNGRGYCKNSHFWNAINKYGWNGFDHDILFSGLSKTQAKVMEVSLISYYDSTNRNKGYNFSPGGELASEESRRKRSEALKGDKNPMYGKHHTKETREELSRKLSGENNPNYGKHLSEEQKQNLSKKLSGENSCMYGKTGFKNHSSKPIMCTTTGYCFGSSYEAAKYYKIDSGDIRKCCRGKKAYCGKLPDGTKLKWKHIKDLPKPQVSNEQKQLLRNSLRLLKSA